MFDDFLTFGPVKVNGVELPRMTIPELASLLAEVKARQVKLLIDAIKQAKPDAEAEARLLAAAQGASLGPVEAHRYACSVEGSVEVLTRACRTAGITRAALGPLSAIKAQDLAVQVLGVYEPDPTAARLPAETSPISSPPSEVATGAN